MKIHSPVFDTPKLLSAMAAACGKVIGPTSGAYYDSSIQANAATTLAGAANRFELIPFITELDFSIDRIGVYVTTGVASSTVKLVIYNSTVDGKPDTIEWEGGNLSSATSSTFVQETLSFTFTAGIRYWLGVRHSSTATLRAIPVTNLPNLGRNGSTGNTYYTALRRTLTYDTPATTPWAFVVGDLNANVTATSIMVRKA